jgi:hypothetical protein
MFLSNVLNYYAKKNKTYYNCNYFSEIAIFYRRMIEQTLTVTQQPKYV